MANMVDPLRRAQYDNSSPNNPWNIAPNVSQPRNLALAELGESYPQPFLVPGHGKKTKKNFACTSENSHLNFQQMLSGSNLCWNGRDLL